MSFATFPEFSKLTYADKAYYESLIKNYPPVAEISFQRLKGWWGLREDPRISLLNENIIIDYSLREDSKMSGLSIIGTHEIDESICAIFDYLRNKNEAPKLLHVPEFVINNMDYPELFNFDPEHKFDEYIISVPKFFPIKNSSFYQRRRVAQFINNAQGKHVNVHSLDLSKTTDQKVLLDCMDRWPKHGLNNKPPYGYETTKAAIKNATRLGLNNVCLTIDDELHGFLLFQTPFDKRHITLEYGMVSYASSHILNFMVYVFAEWLVKQGVEYTNLGMDYGKPSLRIIKLSLSPVNFFRKYTIKPAQED